MDNSNYASLDELIKENQLLKKELEQKQREIINLLNCKNTDISYNKPEDEIEFSDNDKDYWTAKMKEYGVSSIAEVKELMNIEAIENCENVNIDYTNLINDNESKGINFLNNENYNLYMLGYSDYPEQL